MVREYIFFFRLLSLLPQLITTSKSPHIYIYIYIYITIIYIDNIIKNQYYYNQLQKIYYIVKIAGKGNINVKLQK